ncbi:MAG TPA: ABC transporter ATP-binding protein/permease [Steroidobacteraceae bacterium]|jgi:putative ATP-binding cassette transporter|nr:ABC transporter ATP-binding protein/permease [Steroidobacteraceae bacterium]
MARKVTRQTRRSEQAQAHLLPQLRQMTAALWASPVRNALLLLGACILLDVIATAYGQIRLNRWNQPFYDTLSRRDLSGFLYQLVMFGIIAGSLLALNVGIKWLGEMLKLKLRQGLVLDLIAEWLVPRRAFRLANAGPMGVNPDQRMHEDARHLTELSSDLGIGLLQASILLATFISVLWGISSGFGFQFRGRLLVIPGYMVWAAFIYAGSASLLSYWVGRNLIDANADRYAREADLRFSLVRVSEHIDSVSLAGGETDEARRLRLDLNAVLKAMRRLVWGLTNLTWVTSGYGWFTIVAPILVAAPIYFDSKISFGGLMMAAGAFTQVQSSLRWFVDNFSTLADWRATLLRVASFRRALLDSHEMHAATGQIELAEGPAGKFVIDRLEIASPSGATMLKEPHNELKAGEHVLIIGETGAGKTLLFRALAGLWPWGGGRITRPEQETIRYMPRTPYLPPGSLREVLAYPYEVHEFNQDSYAKALERMQLQRLTPMLDQTKRWEQELNEDEQQQLAFARLLLKAPPWVLIDEVFDSLDEHTLAQVKDVFARELKHSALIHIGRKQQAGPPYARVLHLVNDPDAPRLSRPAAPAEPKSRGKRTAPREPVRADV